MVSELPVSGDLGNAATPMGAYGLRLSTEGGIDRSLLARTAPDWLPWTLTSRIADLDAELAAMEHEEYVGPDSARLTLLPRGYVEIDRLARRSLLTLDHRPTSHELAHPYLATTGAMVAWWQGSFGMHGACAASDGHAVAIVGDRGQGKSSSLMWLLRRGWSSVADDLVVFDGCCVLAGPRSVDLRQETAAEWGVGEFLGTVGRRERWRTVAADVEPATPLAAVVELVWGNEIRIDTVPAAQRLAGHVRYRTLDLPPRDPSVMLSLMGLPNLRLTRPRRLDAIDASMSLLLERLGF